MTAAWRQRLPTEVGENIGPNYVYALVDPRNEEIFYIGKGTGERLLAHGREADLRRLNDSKSDSKKLDEK